MVDHQPPRRPGYAPSSARIRYDLYRLLATIYGSERFPHKASDFEDPASLANLAGEFEGDEMNHLSSGYRCLGKDGDQAPAGLEEGPANKSRLWRS